jgi:CheY-like chemotaxis protein
MKSADRKTSLIMVADPDEDERCLLRSVLRLKGFNVIEAADGHQVINLAKETGPDLLVIDLKLPRLSGALTIQHLRRQREFHTLPIVAVSYGGNGAGRQRLVGRATAHLTKPVQFEHLDKLIDRFLPGQRVHFPKGGRKTSLAVNGVVIHA